MPAHKFRRLRGGGKVRTAYVDQLQEFREIDSALNSLDEFIDVGIRPQIPANGCGFGPYMLVGGRQGWVQPKKRPCERSALQCPGFCVWMPLSPVNRRASCRSSGAIWTRTTVRRELEPSRKPMTPRLATSSCAGIPNGRTPDWMSAIFPLGQRQMRARDMADGLVVSVTGKGDELLLTAVDTCSAEQVRELIEGIIGETHATYVGQIDERRASRDEMNQAVAAYRNALGDDPNALIGFVEAGHPARTGSSPTVRIQLNLPTDANRYAVRDALQWPMRNRRAERDAFRCRRVPSRVAAGATSPGRGPGAELAEQAAVEAQEQRARRDQLLTALQSDDAPH